MRKAEYYAAVYGILRKSDGKILFQRRINTGFNDWVLQLPSGHIEWEESYFEALKREMNEEIWIQFEEKDVILKHVLHRISKNDRVYFDVFFEIQNYTGKIQNLEPEKCSELDFFDFSHNDITPYNRDVIELIGRNITLSEIVI